MNKEVEKKNVTVKAIISLIINGQESLQPRKKIQRPHTISENLFFNSLKNTSSPLQCKIYNCNYYI